MSRVKLADEASRDLVRLFEFLAKYDINTAAAALEAIEASFKLLRDMPTGCPFVPGRADIRKLVIDYGAKGYVAFFEYDSRTDTSVIATILHQNELYDNATIGLQK
jgi:plasmid stabilization system protein ParE